MKKYTIKATRCGYALIEIKTGAFIDGFRHSFGFRCLDDVIKHILKSGDIKPEELDI